MKYKSMGDDLEVGDIVEEIEPPNSRIVHYRVMGIEYDDRGRPTFDVEEIDSEDKLSNSLLWTIVAAVVAGLITLYLLH